MRNEETRTVDGGNCEPSAKLRYELRKGNYSTSPLSPTLNELIDVLVDIAVRHPVEMKRSRRCPQGTTEAQKRRK